MSSPPASPRARHRTDIQGLRAVAVLMVFVFHTWPSLMPGGFVGVDVFFVVSGYLVVGLLLRELRQRGRIDLRRFYARRIRRLLPVATTVLGVVGLATPFLLPATRWRDVARDVVASVLYVQNWNLAERAVDYHAQDSAASPLLHYWSLSIEEQFYLVCPALLLVVARFGRRAPELVIGLVFAGSLAASLWWWDAPQAYFITTTRAWELAIGGLLAAGGFGAKRLGGLGLAAMLGAAFFVRSDMPFPGWVALVPTLGCAAVLSTRGEGVVARILGHRALTWVGDHSYSIYLWHWPLVVWWIARDGALGPTAFLVIGLGTAGLSALSYRFVEEAFRHPGPGVPRASRMALASLLPLAAAAWTLTSPIVDASLDRSLHPGGRVLFGAAAPPEVPPSPDARAIREPRHRAFLVPHRGSKPEGRTAGVDGGPRVYMVGDSHLQHWEPAFIEVAEARGWSLTMHAKMACGLSELVIERKRKPYTDCHAWGAAVLAELEADPPDLVILGNSTRDRPYGLKGKAADRAMIEAMRALWTRLAEGGSTVVVLPDVPRWKKDPVECWLKDPSCRMAVDDHAEVGRDLVQRAAATHPTVRVLDLEDTVCADGWCTPVIGNVFVYRDHGHLTPEYTASVSEEVGRRLDAVLEGSDLAETP